MTKRNQRPFPIKGIDNNTYLKIAWEKGWLNDYSNDHFLIKAIENKLNDIDWKKQLISNNQVAYFSPLNISGDIDYNSFMINFILNLSYSLEYMSKTFGEEKIKEFITNQLAAGKFNYNPNSFFQALSEIEILKFYCNRYEWDQALYEPPIGQNGSNPEASFSLLPSSERSLFPQGITVNIEVKTPGFHLLNDSDDRRVIPTILLNDEGRSKFAELCKLHDLKCVMPRITKIIDFLNSAAKKFNKPKENELNLLYINWSYSDFPSNSFLEAWSLLTNEINGVLNHPEIGMRLPFKEPLHKDVYEKISAIVVYTSSLDQLMFSDFRFSWQRNGIAGHRFRMILNENDYIGNITDKYTDALFQISGMNPDLPSDTKFKILFERNWSSKTSLNNQLDDCKFMCKAEQIVNKFSLH